MSKASDKILEKAEKLKKKIDTFGDLIDSLESVEEKKRFLWKEAYENAVNDRNIANTLLTELTLVVLKSPANHAIHGPVMTKYLEKMLKANDQILKLAEILTKELEAREVNIDDIYKKIEG